MIMNPSFNCIYSSDQLDESPVQCHMKFYVLIDDTVVSGPVRQMTVGQA